jgi:hypothetical protein
MNDEDKRAIYQELLDAVRKPTRADYPEPNITVDEYIALLESEDVNRQEAYNALESKVEEGVLKKANVKVGDRACNIYWKA